MQALEGITCLLFSFATDGRVVKWQDIQQSETGPKIEFQVGQDWLTGHTWLGMGYRMKKIQKKVKCTQESKQNCGSKNNITLICRTKTNNLFLWWTVEKQPAWTLRHQNLWLYWQYVSRYTPENMKNSNEPHISKFQHDIVDNMLSCLHVWLRELTIQLWLTIQL